MVEGTMSTVKINRRWKLNVISVLASSATMVFETNPVVFVQKSAGFESETTR